MLRQYTASWTTCKTQCMLKKVNEPGYVTFCKKFNKNKFTNSVPIIFYMLTITTKVMTVRNFAVISDKCNVLGVCISTNCTYNWIKTSFIKPLDILNWNPQNYNYMVVHLHFLLASWNRKKVRFASPFKASSCFYYWTISTQLSQYPKLRQYKYIL
jgi:hypothetical protein